MKLQASGKTDTGRVRNNNEDSYFFDSARGLFIVADGMGGHAAGEVASRMAVETVCQSLPSGTANLQQLRESIEQANQVVEQAANGNPAWRGMGTTLTALQLHQQQGLLAHVGDSRAYRLHDTRLEQLSDDHSLVGEQLRQGLLSATEARSSNLGNILLQAVGITPELDVCRRQFELTAGERYLLCSDGLTDMLTDSQICRILQQDLSPERLCDGLVGAAMTAGGKDNITVIVVQIDSL